MLKFERPAVTAGFRNLVRAARLTTRKGIKAGITPIPFPPHWSKVKSHFMAAQHGKCGFCEGPVLGLQYGDVEHYRPKGAVDILDHANSSNWGSEQPWSAVVKGRKTFSHSTTGYWWKAYNWSNYLVVCQICNQQWKQCLFPIAGRPPRPAVAIQNNEQALLLNPYGKLDPALHLAFGRIGEVSAYKGSPEGHATILTCGLDRPSLRRARHDLAQATHQRIDEISADITSHDLHRLLHAILASGHASRPYCGMVRAIFLQRMDMSWEDLIQLEQKLHSELLRPARRLCLC
jgi:hypothetical protein